MIKKHFVFFTILAFFAIIFSRQPLFAQNGIRVTVEIQNIEKSLAAKNITPAERHASLVRLARLRQLSGDIEGAAKNWLEAAVAIPGKVDDDALLSCAYCLAAMGEWERAAAAVKPLLNKSQRARFLDVSMNAWKTGDTLSLAALAQDSEYSAMKSEIYFMLWKIQGGGAANAGGVNAGITGEDWKQRLLVEFPQSPEARLAASENSSLAVKPSPFWLFLSGRETIAQMENTARDTSQIAPQIVPQAAPAPQPSQSASSQSAPQTAKTPMPQVQTAPQPAQTTPQSEPQSAPQAAKAPVSASRADTARLQTGIFTREDNARTQIENLRKAGFTSALERRIVNGNEMWAVIVPAGADANRTMNDLKKSGFDSFVLK